jgi:uncharacterized protein YxjI
MRYHIIERAWSLPEDFVVRDDDGSAVFEIRGAFEDFKIETGDGSTMRIKGDTVRWDFSVVDQTGYPLAHIGRQYSNFPNSYTIEVAQNVDEVAMVALVIVMDMVRERQEKSASK